VLLGSITPDLVLFVCDEDTPWDEASATYADEFRYIGFEQGAEVLVGVVTDPDTNEM